MLVLDSETQQDWQKAAKQQESAALRQQALLNEIMSNSISVSDDAGRDTSNLLAQLGKPMGSQEVQRRLKLCNPKLIFKPSISDKTKVGIYVEKPERLATGGWKNIEVFVCGMEAGIMPEFSVLHKAEKEVANPELFGNHTPTREVQWKKVPTFASETRGWRTVLVRLLHNRLIQESHVRKHFGWTPSLESERWANQTR